MGFNTENKPRTQWTLIVGNALRRCRVGHGIPCLTNGKKASLISRSFRTEKVIVECLLGYKTDDGYRLGGWVDVQRRSKDTMDVDRRQRLEALPGWSWDVLSDQWEEGFAHLKEFSDREGHCRVPASYKTDDGYRLGQWVQTQRSVRTRWTLIVGNALRRCRAGRGIRFPINGKKGFAYLREYSNREGHCRVPHGYTTDDGFRLGGWVSKREARKQWN